MNDTKSSWTYLTTEELAGRIKYDARTIRNRLKDTVLLEGVHYIRPFGGRKILFLWEKIERDMASFSAAASASVAPAVMRDNRVQEPALLESGRALESGPRHLKRPAGHLIPMASGGNCHV